MAQTGQSRREQRLRWLVALFLAELVVLAMAYQFWAEIECQGTDAAGLCRGLRSLVARAMGVTVAAAVLAWARPALARRARGLFAGNPGSWLAMAAHFLGLGLLVVPLVVAGGVDMSPLFARLAPFWMVGALLAGLGGLFWLAPPAIWRRIAGPDAVAVVVSAISGLLLPDLADLILPLWYGWPALTRMTFDAVGLVLTVTGAAVHVDAPGYIIGVGGFFVHIAQQCSGVEGLALVGGFTVLYAALMWRQLHVPRYFLTVLPLGLLLSWTLNVLRIAALIVIGDQISPELAVNGFHSYAGWFFFTLLALGLMTLVHNAAWLHRDAGRGRPVAGGRLRADPLAAQIVPFIAFMLVSILVAGLWPVPELGYPVKALALVLAVVAFGPALLRLDRALHWPAVLGGVAVGGLWLLAGPVAGGGTLAAALGELTPEGRAIWIAARLLGTVALVPIIEEQFFRGYVLGRLDRGGMAWRIVALLVSSLLFGLLHGRLVAATLAGLVFGGLRLWRGRVGDAIWAHVIANALIAAAALMQDDWSLI